MNQCTRSKYVSISNAATSRGGRRESKSAKADLSSCKSKLDGCGLFNLDPVVELLLVMGVSNPGGFWPPGMAVVIEVSIVVD